MGKKYIIELLDDCPSEFKGIIVFGLTPTGQISAEPIPVEELTPYTEPDIEQVRKEAYEKGLIEAWECAKKIQDTGGNLNWWIHNTSASEAIEKIRQYEQEQEEIKVGDEVERILNGEVDSKAVFLGDDEGYYHCLFWTGACFTTLSYPKKQFRKTGRHFPEIAAVLEKMRGEQE